MLKALAIFAAIAYVVHRYVPRVKVTTPVVLTVVSMIVGIRTMIYLFD